MIATICAAQRPDPVQRLDHRPHVQPAIGTPVAAIEHHGDRSLGEQRRQADQPAGLIGQHEGRHRLARPRRILAAAVFVDARHQPVDRFAIGRKELPPRGGIGFELFAQRAFHVAALLEGQLETLGIGWR